MQAPFEIAANLNTPASAYLRLSSLQNFLELVPARLTEQVAL